MLLKLPLIITLHSFNKHLYKNGFLKLKLAVCIRIIVPNALVLVQTQSHMQFAQTNIFSQNDYLKLVKESENNTNNLT